MNNTPANSLHRLSFFTLAGETEASFEGDQVTGRWLDPHSELRIRHAGSLAEAFANWRDDAAGILKFTRKYGPLETAPFTLESGAVGEFLFSITDWRKQQRVFRQTWDLCGKIPADQFDASVNAVARGELLVRRKAGLEYRTVNLLRLLTFDLDNVPVERLRRCVRPDCSHPYFVARHLKQNYCSDLCAAWGQSQWKRKWWAEHGKTWRAKRRKSSKRGKPHGR